MALLFTAASQASAQSIVAPEGRYWWSCDTSAEWETYDGRLEVVGNELRFMESSCTLSNPAKITDLPSAAAYDATCSGEGEEWNERMTVIAITNSATRHIDLIRDQGEYSFQSCPGKH